MDKIILDAFNSLGYFGVVLLTLVEIVCALLFSGLIGFEREYHGHAAGLRTHILVAVGSCLIMILSIKAPGFSDFATRDPARLAAQVVSGIGFLGAGTIIQTGTDIKGLTTAATIWLVSAIGLACGAGFFSGAIITTAVSIFALLMLTRVERLANRKIPRIILTIQSDRPVLKEVILYANKYGIQIKDVKSTIIKQNGVEVLRITVTCSKSSFPFMKSFAQEIKSTLNPIDIKVLTH